MTANKMESVRYSACGCYRNAQGYNPCREHKGVMEQLEKVVFELGMIVNLQAFTLLVDQPRPLGH